MGLFKKEKKAGPSVRDGMASVLANGNRPFTVGDNGEFTIKGQGDDLEMVMVAMADDAFIHYTVHVDVQTSGWNLDSLYLELNRLNMKVPYGNFVISSNENDDDLELLFRYDYPHLNNPDPSTIGQLTDLMFDIVDRHDGDLKKLAEAVPEVPDSMYGRSYQLMSVRQGAAGRVLKERALELGRTIQETEQPPKQLPAYPHPLR